MNSKDQNFQDFVENVWQPGLDEQAAELPAWMEEWLDEAMNSRDTMTSLPSLPDIIRSQHDTVRFCMWLGDHPEITYVQGWEIERYASNNMPSRFGTHFADAQWMWSERRSLNDWIRTYWERVI